MVAPIIAAKAAGGVSKALSGDIWSRTTTREVGKGKDKRMVESTVRVNAGTALLGAAAVATVGVGLGITAFMLGLKPVPTTTTVTYGKWVWPDGVDASKVILSTAKGTAPTRKTGVIIYWAYEGAGWHEVSQAYFDSLNDSEIYIPTKTTQEVQSASWVVTETKDKLGFDIGTRPTLSEGLTGVVSMVSVPFQLATNPLAPVSDGIQAIKDIFHLP